MFCERLSACFLSSAAKTFDFIVYLFTLPAIYFLQQNYDRVIIIMGELSTTQY